MMTGGMKGKSERLAEKKEDIVELNRVYNEDCIGPNGMCRLSDKSIDLLFCDLPYGSTNCAWDSIIPFDLLWEQYKRIIKPDGVIVLTGTNPFASMLLASNPAMYRYEWIWDKTRGYNFQQANYQPMRSHEQCLVFSHSNAVFSAGNLTARYNPIKTDIHIVHKSGTPSKTEVLHDNNWQALNKEHEGFFPKSIITIPKDDRQRKKLGKTLGLKVHKTTKPIKLVEYFIETYTTENDVVLDNAMGGGTSGIAAVNTNRNYIGFEWNAKNPQEYYHDCVGWIEWAKRNRAQFYPCPNSEREY
jgi:hypothetical protein